ncbi:hypothetical protein Dda_0813 [Drechslerella dactyloides]|uniref:Uncharacterized protein n=1 Tax=Drechslerella dactyloides TaxID=74499 RepID=A0AAD6J6X1_DREDA|nr:hypothetical protein Dda_0813 [Drechslerella dactyloides]
MLLKETRHRRIRSVVLRQLPNLQSLDPATDVTSSPAASTTIAASSTDPSHPVEESSQARPLRDADPRCPLSAPTPGRVPASHSSTSITASNEEAVLEAAMVFGSSLFTGRFRPKPLPGTALYSTTTNRSGPVLKYDDQSGALYTEALYKSPSAALSLLDQPGPVAREALLRRYRRTNPERQDKTLFNHCRQIVLQHAESLTPDVLIYLPWRYGKILWEDLIHCTADSFAIFRNFCEVYGHEPDFHPGQTGLCSVGSWALESRRLKLPMSESIPWTPIYIPSLTTPSMAWIVNLVITGQFDVWELKELNGLTNLVSLSLSFSTNQARSRPLGRVFRSWVTNKDRLDNLRVLSFVNLPEVTFTDESKVLTILDGLPKLKLIELLASGRRNKDPKNRCELLYKDSFGIEHCDTWQAFCGSSKCRSCRKNAADDDILAQISKPIPHRDGQEGGHRVAIKMRQVVDFLIEKEKMVDGKRRVIVDVAKDSSKQKIHRRISFFRRNIPSSQTPSDNMQQKVEKKKRRLSDSEADEGVVPPKRKPDRAYKVKASKRQDIGSLLDSFR